MKFGTDAHQNSTEKESGANRKDETEARRHRIVKGEWSRDKERSMLGKVKRRSVCDEDAVPPGTKRSNKKGAPAHLRSWESVKKRTREKQANRLRTAMRAVTKAREQRNGRRR